MLELRGIAGRSIVILKTGMSCSEAASEKLGLPEAGRFVGSDPKVLWIGPDCWLFCSDTKSADELIHSCESSLSGEQFTALDYSAAYAAFSISGSSLREVLASGTGIDLRVGEFGAGDCVRCRLAGIAATVVAETNDQFTVLVDRSYEQYFSQWINDTASIVGSGEILDFETAQSS